VKYGVEFMLFIKACRYYGLMKNDMAVDGKGGDEMIGGGTKSELNRDA